MNHRQRRRARPSELFKESTRRYVDHVIQPQMDHVAEQATRYMTAQGILPEGMAIVFADREQGEDQ